MQLRPSLAILILAALAGTTATVSAAEADGIVFFESKVRPLLIEHCLECHATDTKQKGGLLLDSRAGWQTGGDNGPAIIPGDPEHSLLIKAVRHTDRDLLMPPKNKLSSAEIAALTQWIAMGAPDPREKPALASAKTKAAHSKPDGRKHWAFQPPTNPPVPPVRASNRVRTPVDAFLLARLEKAGLGFSPEADRATFIRRATLDLTGLLPTPEAVVAFVNDPRQDAYERLIDDLLASPHYGERWGRHWLDAAGYVDGKIDNDLGTVIPHDGGWRYPKFRTSEGHCTQLLRLAARLGG
jgi:mono/diheme cytochrome c family protein